MQVAVRRRSVGAEVTDGGVHFRVWAPARESVSVVLEGGGEHRLEREDNGYFGGSVDIAQAGMRYRFRLDQESETWPDPASRFQPEGPHGPSEVIDPTTYDWRDRDWEGLTLHGLVGYEMHVGTFTAAGTFAAAIDRLPDLAAIGVNYIELMPLADFPGRFGWGYDGVNLWAPSHLYGRPEDLRRLIDAAHALGIGVILDVVYNHLGPDGNYLTKYSPYYFTNKYTNEWGDPINFDGERSDGVRDFFAENAGAWIEDYHLDGLRLDATQSIHDHSPTHVLQLIASRARAASGSRSIIIVAENEPQDVRLLDYGIDALWNDDWHHSAMVALTGRAEAYYSGHRGKPQEFVSMARLSFLYQGQRYSWQRRPRGTPTFGIAPERFVHYLENHDQVANTAHGLRLRERTSPGRLRALTTLLLLGPQTPLLFQGQEFGSASPFRYFADHEPELAEKVAHGRGKFLTQFPSLRGLPVAAPHDEATFLGCKLDHSQRHAPTVALHRDLIRLRRTDPTFSEQRSDNLYGAVLSEEAFLLRWVTGGAGDRLLLINLGSDLSLTPAPDPLLAPPAGMVWELLWHSEDPDYEGSGIAPFKGYGQWSIPGQSAVLLRGAGGESA